MLAVLLAATLSATMPSTDYIPGPTYGIAKSITDGDTIVAEVYPWLDQKQVAKVRIRGADTAEKAGKCPHERQMAVRATEFTAALVRIDRLVALSEIEHDKYGGRTVATVSVKGADGAWIDVGAALLAAGLAKPYDGNGPKAPWC